MKKCPKCGNSEFLITPHVTQTWKVGGNGNYLETTEECVETTYIPDDDDIWTCAREGCDWSGVGSECNEKNAGEEYMTEDEYTEIREAAKKLCNFCELDSCEKCQVQLLLDDARNEAVDAGLITED